MKRILLIYLFTHLILMGDVESTVVQNKVKCKDINACDTRSVFTQQLIMPIR